jgi:hypothetical protein
MRRSLSLLALAGIGLLSAWAVRGIDAQEASNAVKSQRGGLLAKTARYQFEVFFYPTGVRVFSEDASGAAVDSSRLTATATFYHPNSPKAWFSRPLHSSAGSLDLAIGLSNAPATGAKVTFEVTGLPDSSESTATFTVPLEFVTRTASQPTPPQGGVATVPRYNSGFGYRGYGYYENTSPAPTSSSRSTRSYMSSIPSMFGPGGMTVGPGHRDWTTGRTSPLAKPWLRPID